MQEQIYSGYSEYKIYSGYSEYKIYSGYSEWKSRFILDILNARVVILFVIQMFNICLC